MNYENSEKYVATRVQRMAGLFLPCYAYFTIMGIPLIFNAIITRLGVDSGTATIATTAEVGCISAATLLVSLMLNSLKPRLTMVLAVSLILIGELASVLIDDFAVLVAARAMAGIGKGLCIGLGLASLARMRGGMRLLSHVGGLTAIITWLGFLIVPAMEERLGAAAVFLFNIVLGVVGFAMAFSMPNRCMDRPVTSTLKAPLSINPKSLSVFSLCLLSSIGASACWLYLQQVGENNGLTATGVGLVGSVATLASVCAPFIATVVFARVKSVWPMLLACLSLGLCSHEYVNTTILGFWMVVIVMSILYLFLMAYARMYSAHVDSSGRSTAAVGAADALGLLIGPVLVATLINLDHGYVPLGNLGSALQFLCVFPVLLMLLAKRGVAPVTS
jgi:predicted MFS family arabinose efflux permease